MIIPAKDWRRLTRSIFHSKSHLQGKDTAFRRQIGTHMGYTVGKADLSSQKSVF